MKWWVVWKKKDVYNNSQDNFQNGLEKAMTENYNNEGYRNSGDEEMQES